MYIDNVKLNNYRNYKSLDVQFNNGINIIYGDNGQGKTNILESIFVCSSGKSHRTAHDIELINTEADCFCIDLLFTDNTGQKDMKFMYNRQKEKSIAVNGINLKKMGELMGKVISVIFSPEDLMIIKQGPQVRRKIMDIVLSQINPSYFYCLQQYNKTLTQRNSLLKQIKKNRSFIETIDIWDETLASYGREIINRRTNFISDLGNIIKENHYHISGRKEELEIKYDPSVNEEEIFIKLKQNINSDIERENTYSGPHKDDILFLLNEKNLKIYGSQGQQRTAVLSLKLAELDIMERETEEKPILLLDDVLSELDEKRQGYLFERIGNIQTFITGTEKAAFKNTENLDFSYYHIYEGQLL